MTIRIGIAGIMGRMGREIYVAGQTRDEIAITGGLIRPGSLPGREDSVSSTIPLYEQVDQLLSDVDVLIDFTTPEATVAHTRACAEVGRPIVTGVTGLSEQQIDELRKLGSRTPVFYARNMSVGLNALLAVLPSLVRALHGYDVEIIETHHRHKVDAPSGTALALAETIATALDRRLDGDAVYGRHGVAPRTPGQIGIHAVRAGGNAGEHVVVLADEGEELRIAHRSYSRGAFATGAIRAAIFLAGQPSGFYTMRDLAGAPAG